jgi:MFS family permease
MNIIIIIATCIAITALIPLFFVEEPTKNHTEDALIWGPIPTELKRFAFINSIFHLGSISYMFLTLRVHDFAGIFSPIQNALLMYITFNIIHAICATPFGSIIDCFNKKNCVLVGYLTHGLVMLGFLLAKTPVQFWMLFMAYGASLALTDISQRTLAINLAPVRRQGTAIGLVYAAIGISQIAGSTFCGFVWEYTAHEYIFFLGIVTTIVSTGLLFISSITIHSPAQ